MSTTLRTKTVAKIASDVILCDLYLRLSDGRNENGSFLEREKTLRTRAVQLGWTVHRVVVENDLPGMANNASAFKRRKVTLPDGTTALRVVRPGFRSLLDDLATGRVQAVLAEDLDRTMRDPRDAQDLIDVIRDRRANARSLSGSLTLTDGGTDSEIAMTEIMVTMARKSSSDTARRVTAARARQADVGQWGGGRRPYGFTAVPDPAGNHQNSTLVVNEAEAEVVRAAANALLAQVSLKAIAKDLRDRDVPTVTGARWTAETLRDVLLKPVNAGIVVYQKEETDVRLPGEPILNEDTYRAVVTLLMDPSRSTGGTGGTPTWLGSGFYLCVCRSVMEIQGGRGRARSYRCAHDAASIGTVHVRRNAKHVDNLVSEFAIRRLAEPDTLDLVQPPSPTLDTGALRAEATVQRALLTDLAHAFADSEITRAQLAAGTVRIKAKLDKIEAALASVTDVSPLTSMLGVADVRAAWEKLTVGERRAMLRHLLTVTILPTTQTGMYRGFDPDRVRITLRVHGS